MNLAHGSKIRGSDVHLHGVKNDYLDFFSLNSFRVLVLGWSLLGFLSGFFLIFVKEGSVAHLIYREYIVFRGSIISCSMASSHPHHPHPPTNTHTHTHTTPPDINKELESWSSSPATDIHHYTVRWLHDDSGEVAALQSQDIATFQGSQPA